MTTLVKEQAATTSLKLPVQTDGTERRRGLRIAQARPVKIFEHASNRYFPGQTMDVSATGLRIELPVSSPVRAGKLLSIHVGLSHAGETLANRRQMIPARVIWIDRTPHYLKDYLRANGVPDAFEDWINTGAVIGVSRDGRVLVGYGAGPRDFTGYIVILPPLGDAK